MFGVIGIVRPIVVVTSEFQNLFLKRVQDLRLTFPHGEKLEKRGED